MTATFVIRFNRSDECYYDAKSLPSFFRSEHWFPFEEKNLIEKKALDFAWLPYASLSDTCGKAAARWESDGTHIAWLLVYVKFCGIQFQKI